MADRARLSKTLKPHWVWAIALGSAVGWGSFILPTDWMGTAGPLGAVAGLLIGGVLMIVIAVSYGFMIQKIPVSGGEFAYSYVGFGRNHAYLCGWFLTLGYLSIVALNASALALLCRYMLPAIAEWGRMYEIAGWDVYLGEVLIASLALVVFAVLNIRGAALSGRLQFAFVIIMIAGAGLVALGVFLHPDSSFGNFVPAFSPDTSAWAAVLAIVAIAPWAYVGFDNVPQAAEEFDFPPRKAYRLIVLALVAAAVFYSMMVLATAVATPWQGLVASEPQWGTGDAVAGLFGWVGTLLLSVAVCMGVFTGLNGFFMASSRLMFAMGRARIVPAAFARVHPRFNTPYVGILFAGAICLVTPWFGREALLWVVDMSAVGVAIAYSYTCFVAFRLFREAPGKRVLAALGGLFGLGFIGLLLVPASPAALGPESWTALIAWTVLGALFYLARVREYRKIPKSEMDYLILDTPKPAPSPQP
ncbi:MAG: amino acid permease [Pseudonocardiaceae bacterium]|nr:amino acid permease [Pseudonocardiaceae bacterium]